MNQCENLSAKRKNAPFRYDVVGSFLRPEALKKARKDYRGGMISKEKLKEVEDREILKLVQKEKDAGLQSVTDGEFRRSWWHLDFMWGLQGVERKNLKKGYLFHDEVTRGETASLSGKISGENHPFLEHYRFLREAAGNDVLARQTIPAPAQFLAELYRAENKDATDRIYPDIEMLIKDISSAYQTVLSDLYQAGCRNVQIDDCTWGMFCDQKYWQARQDNKVDLKSLADLYLKANNMALESCPADLTVNTHVCRGNYHSTWAASGGYEPIAEVLFGGENVSAYYLEFDSDRCGDFSPLRNVPADKLVVLGLVSSKTPQLEDKETLIARIREAERYVPLERLCLSPQCGFASTEEGNLLTEADQWAKIALVREVAREVWKDC
ncbi:5-methyltetrahydropteroyltriglutamate--homocysteine methyltransferase [Caprobacter fermentans]|uniref:5-methyltetrahydropteroyltriglutamate--homocysteine methyltransferase n=1 Tax=Caproicibacter fermentans TaxID=2576756 RepID=A0A6N8I2G1_9FIRM|nr:5-methyltetrahydropteroyltriglutamate--homocysteine S-methyltransferase [Caproicibacter fermentans]MVB11860.1 5-methyltetrahydropteroyltriglutamate--homocysteine methyltransferase [Caproicibacter fermentans]